MYDLKQIYQAFSSSNNPKDIFFRMANNNPQLQPIMQKINNGVNPEQLFKDLCTQKGVNPEEFIKKITG